MRRGKAAHATAITPYQRKHTKAVAVGIGDNSTDAKLMLDTLSLANMHGARSGTSPEFIERY